MIERMLVFSSILELKRAKPNLGIQCCQRHLNLKVDLHLKHVALQILSRLVWGQEQKSKSLSYWFSIGVSRHSMVPVAFSWGATSNYSLLYSAANAIVFGEIIVQ